MTRLPTRGRGLAAVAALALAAASIPALTVGASAAVGGYVLSGDNSPSQGVSTTYFLSNPSLGPAGLPGGLYCTAASIGNPAPVESSPVSVDDGDISAALNATFTAPGTYTLAAIELPDGAFSCPGTLLIGTPVLATEVVHVAGGAAYVSVSPGTASVATNTPTSFSVTYFDSGFNPTNLGTGQSAVVTSNSGTTTFNGPSQTTLTLTSASFPQFTAQNSAANANAVITVALKNGASTLDSDQATLSTLPAGTLTVNPTTAITAYGGTTNLTVTLTNGAGLPAAGVPVSVASTGRNTFGTTNAGSTNVNGQVVWAQKDNAPASSTATQDVVTFTASGLHVVATVTYSNGSLTVAPATTTTAAGGTTALTVTLKNGAGAPVANASVTVSSSGRNTFGTTNAGTTNAAGQVVWNQKDNAASTSTATTDVVTFAANSLTATATITYSLTPPPPSVTVTVTSPSNGSAISSGGLFNVYATSTGVAAGTQAYLTLNGSAKAVTTVPTGGAISFMKIPAQAGQYAVRICGGACGATQGVSSSFSLTIIPFQIVPPAEPGAGQLDFTVAVGNWQPGTTIYLTRNGTSVATGKVQKVGQQIVIQTRNLPGTYQVRVNSNQGYVYGNQAGVVVIS